MAATLKAKHVLRRVGLRRRHIALMRMCCERHWWATRHRPGSSRSRILCYHSVGTPEWGVNDVAPRRFAEQLEHALENGWQFVSATQIARSTEPGSRQVAITFDDGLRSVAENAAPILASYNIPWSLFVVSDWADGKHSFEDVLLTWPEIQRMVAMGATVGSHSVTHPDFSRLDTRTAIHEVVHSADVIESRLGLRPVEFAIPLGQSQNWSADAAIAAKAAGYEVVYAQSEDLRPAGTVPRTFITSFDTPRLFRAALAGSFDRWEEWI